MVAEPFMGSQSLKRIIRVRAKRLWSGLVNKILILDDDSGVCKVIGNILTEEGYEIITANNGKEGFQKIKEEKPDVVLLDVKLPDIDGLSFIEEHPQITANSSIVVLTGYGDIKSAVQSMKLGVFDYLTKPFDEEKILIPEKRVKMAYF